MEFKDYYATMGVARDATAEQIKQAYRKLARQYHPDVSKEPDAEARFKEVGEAYEVLRDAEKRAAYDQLGSGPRPGEPFQPPPDWGAGFEFRGDGGHAPGGHGAAFEGDPSEFFETLFGRAGFAGSQAHRRGEQGEDHHARVMIDLDASLEGGTRSLTLRIPEYGDDGHPRLRERTLNVKIPKGIQAGQHIRLAGQGEKPPGEAKAGDLILEVGFAPHRLYRPEGRDLHLDVPVAPWEAALGASVTVPTPEGPVSLRVPPGSRAGTRLRLRGRGLPAQPAGDLYAVLQIALPPADSAAARAAYEAFAAATQFNPRSSLGVEA
jgi:curved DNA-binding protein